MCLLTKFGRLRGYNKKLPEKDGLWSPMVPENTRKDQRILVELNWLNMEKKEQA